MSSRESTLRSLLDEGGASFKENSKSFILDCPKCSKKDKLYLRKNDGRFVCWYCREANGFQGAPEYALKELLGTPLQKLKAAIYGSSEVSATLFIDIFLEDWFGEEDEDEVFLEEELSELIIDPDFVDLDNRFAKAGVEYLKSRGIPLPVAKKYGLMYSPKQERVVFPVLREGKCFGWQSRLIKPKTYYDKKRKETVNLPKMISAIGMKKDRTIMFGDNIKSDYVVLCEGPIDAIKADLCGGNVATMGKAIGKAQLELMKNSGVKKIYLAIDPDAYKEAQKLLREVTDVEFYDMRPPRGKHDLGDMTFDEVYESFLNAPKITKNFLFVYLKDYYARKR